VAVKEVTINAADLPAPQPGATPRRRVTFNGEAGTRWTNSTGEAQYQFVCDLVRTCGACLQYHMAIGPFWPIPIHRNCRCRQYRIEPHAAAPHEFVDFREVLDGMTQAQKRAAIGASNYKLLQAGVVKWDEIVTRYRVRTLQEVVAVNKVTLPTLERAGVKKYIAAKAHAAVHTPEQELVRQHQAELIRKIEKAGVSQEELVKELARQISGRVGIVGGGNQQRVSSFLPPAPPRGGALAALLNRPKPPKPAPTAKELAHEAAERAKSRETPQRRLDQARAEQEAANQASAEANPIVTPSGPTTNTIIQQQEQDIQKARATIAKTEQELDRARPEYDAMRLEAGKMRIKIKDKALSFEERDEAVRDLSRLQASDRWFALKELFEKGQNTIEFERRTLSRLEESVAKAKVRLAPKSIEYAKDQAAHPNLIAPGHIADRITQYKVGDAKHAEVMRLQAEHRRKIDAMVNRRTELREQTQGLFDQLKELQNNRPTAWEAKAKKVIDKIGALDRKIQSTRKGQDNTRELIAKKAHKVLELDSKDAMKFDAKAPNAGAKLVDGRAINPVAGDTAHNAKEATAWLSRTVAKGDGTFANAMELKVGEVPGMRANHIDNHGTSAVNILVRPNEPTAVIVHEFGHAIDEGVLTGNESVLKRALEFRAHRLEGQQPVEMNSLFPGRYEAGELGADDDFGKAFPGSSGWYVGKDYSGRASEIVSMGLQKMYEGPLDFAAKDPEYFKFTAGIMDGSLR
jgi:hypothetical protein